MNHIKNKIKNYAASALVLGAISIGAAGCATMPVQNAMAAAPKKQEQKLLSEEVKDYRNTVRNIIDSQGYLKDDINIPFTDQDYGLTWDYLINTDEGISGAELFFMRDSYNADDDFKQSDAAGFFLQNIDRKGILAIDRGVDGTVDEVYEGNFAEGFERTEKGERADSNLLKMFGLYKNNTAADEAIISIKKDLPRAAQFLIKKQAIEHDIFNDKQISEHLDNEVYTLFKADSGYDPQVRTFGDIFKNIELPKAEGKYASLINFGNKHTKKFYEENKDRAIDNHLFYSFFGNDIEDKYLRLSPEQKDAPFRICPLRNNYNNDIKDMIVYHDLNSNMQYDQKEPLHTVDVMESKLKTFKTYDKLFDQIDRLIEQSER